MIGAYIAGFVSFPIVAIAIAAPLLYRAIKRGIDL